MKYLQIKEQLLNEINMSPNSLRKLAADINAQAGIEFEMIVPGAAQEDDDYEMEPDYDSDESVSGIQDAYDFFYDGDYNSRRDVQALKDQMYEDYRDWLGESFSNRWDSDMDTFIYDYLKENASNDEIAEILGREDDDEDTKDNYGRAEVSEAVSKIIEEGSGNTWYDQAYEAALDDYMNDDKEVEWLEDIGIMTMTDISSKYDINWPHYYNPNTGGEVSVDDVANEFSEMIGKPVNASERYHGARREAGHYVVEPDTSLSPDDSGDGGLEFVSPPMPVDEMLDDLKKVKAWADSKGCYTNDSTGLHINISVPGFSTEKLDFVKLAILMGDEYILKEFGREGNTYAKSAMQIVKTHIQQRPEDVGTLLTAMRGHMNTSAAKLIHSGTTNKYTSINTKEGYVEFRSPGGDWLNANFDKIESTLLRFVVALDAATDETKYRDEYAKKLYKLLAPSDDSTNTMQYFAKFAAGELPQSALKSFVKQAQLQRSINKQPANTGKKYWWGVRNSGNTNAGIEVVASSKEEAIEKAINGEDGYPSWANIRSSLVAKPLRPYQEEPASELKAYNVTDASGYVAMFRAHSPAAAEQMAKDQYPDKFRNIVSVVINDRANAGSTAPAASQTAYEIYDRFNNDFVPVRFMAADTDGALTRLEQYRQEHNTEDAHYAVRQSRSTAPTAGEPIPGSTIDLQRQRAAQAGGEFRGQWKVVDGTGRELYRFGGVGNSQRDANRVATQWVQAQGMPYGTEIEVLPVMG